MSNFVDLPPDVTWRTRWADFKQAPRRVHVMTGLALLIPVAAVLYALGAGVWALFWFNHRESATCQVTSEAGPFDGGRNYYWNVTTSCGTYSVNQGDFDLDKSKADDLANQLVIDGDYRLTFLGWGSGREIVAAQLLAG